MFIPDVYIHSWLPVFIQESYDCAGMVPVVDGPGGFLPEMPHEIRGKGEHNKVSIMTGVTTEEAYMFIPLFGEYTFYLFIDVFIYSFYFLLI